MSAQAGMAAFRRTISRWAGQSWPALWRHLPFLLFLAALLAYGGGFAVARLADFDTLDLALTTRDDAFYYFQIAWNMAQGRFSTFDGGLSQTNGYHPLWLFLITPFYWFLDKEAALFAIRALEIMLIAGGVAVIALAAKLCRLPWLLLFAGLPLLYRQPDLFIGMEAAAALFMLALLFLGLALFIGNPGRWKWGLAAVCFALPWVRLEYIAISLAVTAALCLFEFPHWRRAAADGGWAGLRSFHALAPLAGAAAGILVYFAYNGLIFGGLVPVSGATKAAWSQFRWEQEGGYHLADNLRAALQAPVFDGELLAAVEICLWLLPVWWLARRTDTSGGGRRDRLLFAFMLGAFGLAVGHLAVFGQTVLTVHPAYQGKFPWYFVPAYLLMALLVPLRCYAAMGIIRCWVAPRWPRAARPLQAAAVLAAVAGLLWQADFAYPRALPEAAPGALDGRAMRYAGSLTANRGLPEGSVIGAWDAGALGYFSRFPVVNLDGLVNSYAYLRATDTGAEPPRWLARGGRLPPALRELGLTHLATFHEATWEDPLFESRWYDPDGRIKARFKIRLAEGDAGGEAAAFGERLAAAAGALEGGAWQTTDGRLTQAFAPNCAPDELLVWHYSAADDANDAAGGRFPAATTHRSAEGWCTAALISPPGTPAPDGVSVQAAGEYVAQLRRLRPPGRQDYFEVYFLSGPPGTAPQLLYARNECGTEDAAAPFFLHLFPGDPGELAAARQPYGYANADFRLRRPGARFGGWCLAARPLPPDYGISRLRTGQWRPEENRRLWEAEFPVSPPP